MHFHRHRSDGSGFMATAEVVDSLPFSQVGEVWAPGQWSVDWHTNPGWELYIQAKGESWWQVGEETHRVRENGAYLIRQDTRHRLKRMSPGGVHFFWVVFPDSAVPRSLRGARCWSRPCTIATGVHDLLLPMRGLIRETAIKEHWQAEAGEWYLSALCAAFARRSDNLSPEQALGRHPAAERAQRLLESRPEHPWRLDELARLAGVSVPHLVEIFRADYGQTPMRALTRLRLEEARRRL
ncbi:MAG: Helix-turn-helix domain, partial [Verrucomicrobiota bacterium]